jgi:hypothetical protein
LTDDMAFRDFQFHILNFQQNGHMAWTALDELLLIKRHITRMSLCDSCLSAFDSGRLENQLALLWEPQLCIDCRTVHPSFFFSDRFSNVCMGRQGHFALCEHVKLSGSDWQLPFGRHRALTIGNSETRTFIPTVTCKHKSHVPRGSLGHENANHAAPHIAFRNIANPPPICSKTTFYMLKINPLQHTDMGILKKGLRKRLDNLEYVCNHASTQFDAIVACIPSDRCRCFPKDGIASPTPTVDIGSKAANCPNHIFSCRRCNALYTWRRSDDYITLDVEILSHVSSSLSTDWLSNIRFNRKQHSILTKESTKGILWCDNPCCVTGSGHRWLNMVKIFRREDLHTFDGIFDLINHRNALLDTITLFLELQTYISSCWDEQLKC